MNSTALVSTLQTSKEQSQTSRRLQFMRLHGARMVCCLGHSCILDCREDSPTHAHCVGTVLAVLPVASDFIYLWDSLSRKAQKASLGAHVPQQEMKVACWSRDQPQLIIGTTKGTVLLFDASSRRVVQNLPAVHEQVQPAAYRLTSPG